MSKRKEAESPLTGFERKVQELFRLSKAGQVPPQDLLFAMLGLQKLAGSSRISFQEHWPTAILIAQELARSASAPSHIRGAAYALLSFDCLLQFDSTQAEQWALKAQEEGHNHARCCLVVCRHLNKMKLAPKKTDSMGLMNEIDRCLIESVTIEPEASQHQCYLFALHLGLMYGHAKLVAKAEQYRKGIADP